MEHMNSPNKEQLENEENQGLLVRRVDGEEYIHILSEADTHGSPECSEKTLSTQDNICWNA